MLTRTLSGTRPRTRLPAGAVDTQTHMYLPGYPSRPGGPPNPAGDLPTPAQYRQVMEWLGIDRVVITQGNAQQTDNANLLACLAEMGAAARGVAAISPDTGDAEMRRLSDGGVVGLRIMDLPGGAVGLDALEALDDRALDAGWVMAVQFDGNDILDHVDRLRRVRSRWILDHHGKFLRGVAPDGPEIAAVKSLIDGGRCWYKLAACYESSTTGGPDYADVAAVTRALADHAPERIVWGTNWPHNLAKTDAEYPDDAALLDTVLGWLPSDEARHRALVETPAALFGFDAGE